MGIVSYLVGQSKSPKGRVGKAMLGIMSRAHTGYAGWALEQLQGGDRCMEASCGAGAAMRQLIADDKYNTVYGIDYSDEALKAAIRNNRESIAAKRGFVQKADVMCLPFADGYFDAVYTVQSHYHWPDIQRALGEICRVLRPGGRFVLVAETVKLRYHMPEYDTPEANLRLVQGGGFADARLLNNGKLFCIAATK